MGWVSLLEDTLERIQDNLRLAETALEEEENPSEDHRRASLKALKDAEAILARAWQHLELATSPELEFAHKIKTLEKEISDLEAAVKVARHETSQAEKESANHYAELQDAKHEIIALKKENKKVNKKFEKIAQSNFGAAVDAYSSPGMLKKHKPHG